MVRIYHKWLFCQVDLAKYGKIIHYSNLTSGLRYRLHSPPIAQPSGSRMSSEKLLTYFFMILQTLQAYTLTWGRTTLF